MTQLAIDVVLLPPEEIMDKAIEINSSLLNDKIVLDKKKCLPHITLCMGVVDEEKILEITEILKDIAQSCLPLDLTIFAINEEHSTFDIIKTAELQHLHETITNRLGKYCTTKATVEMCYSPPPVEERTLFWINNFREKTSFANFYPHITLAKERIAGKEVNISFTASTLALCHLGNYCTCRKILFQTTLKNPEKA